MIAPRSYSGVALCVPSAPPAGTWAKARALVLRHGWNTVAYQILNPGIRHWFTPDGAAVVGYVVAAGYRVVAGEPIAPPDQLASVAAAFAADARRAGRRVCYFGAQDRFVAAMGDQQPMARLLLGAQPVWQPQGWPALLAGKASLRAQIARARNKQVTVAAWSAADAADHPALRRCLAAWLQTRGLPPLRFLVEPDTLGQLHDRHVLVAQRQGQVLGFLIASPVPQRRGWLVEQLVRGPGAPNGTAELLVDAAMRILAANGADYLTLGLSPLAEHTPWAATPQSVWISTLLSWMRAHGRRFYNFTGLDAFKAKLQPHSWEPVYALSNEPAITLRTLYAITGAFGGTTPIAYLSYALGRALLQEGRWAIKRMHQPAREALPQQ